MRVLCKRKVLFSILAAVMVFSIVFALLLPSTLGVKAATEENVIYYDFTNQDTLDSLKPYFQQAAGSGTGVEEEFSKHWQVDGEGVLSRINDLGGGMDTSFAMLHFDRQFQNFEISYKMRAANTTMGWVGIMFGKSAYSTTMIGDGNAVFFNANNGGAFFQGQTLGGNGDAGNNVIMTGEQYYPGDWNDVVIKVYGSAGESANQKVELWVNGNKMLESNKAVAPVRGNVCLFTTAIAADFKDVSFKYLDENGDYSNSVPAESVTFDEVETNVNVGDEVTLSATVLPENSAEKTLEFVSSSTEIATVSADGKVTFLAKGEVTITVNVKGFPEIKDSIVFNVTEIDPALKITNKISEATVGDEFSLEWELTPENAEAKFVFAASPEDSAKIDAEGNIHFVKAGAVTITIALEDQSLSDSMTVNVNEKVLDPNAIYYDFTNQDTLDSLKPYFQQAPGSGTGVAEEFSKHWQVDGEGVLSRINDLGGGMDTSFAMLHFDRQFQNFEISYKMRAANTTMGWVGIMFGKSAYSTTMIGDGNAVFFNANNGGAFFQGQTLGGNGDAGNNVIMTGEQYYPGDWNDVVIKVYGSAGESANQKVELWVNGNKMLESNKAVAPVRGNVCLFTTAIAADFKDVSFKYLNENGEYSNFVPADSVTIAETATEVYIGDKVALNTTILPENATTRELIFSSSDLSVAIVSQKGEVTFINEGTVTISVSVLDAEEATDTITFNVAAKLSKIEISNKITSANVGDIFTCKVNIVPGDYVTELEFTSTDPDIATVTADGKVTFHKSGTVTIKVRSKEFAGIVDTMTVTVAGESSADNGGDGLPAAAVIGIVCGAVVLVGAAAIVTVMIVKRRKK